MRDFARTRFDDGDHPVDVANLPNLMDLMLVFAVGLIAALVSLNEQSAMIEDIEVGRELSEMPAMADADSQGLEPVGQVYRDPDTGKLFVIK